AMLGAHAELAWAAGPFEQRVEVEITAVRARGPNFDRSQWAEVSIDGTLFTLNLVHGCMDINGCSSHRVDPDTCGAGSGSDPEMFDVTGTRHDGGLIGRAMVAKDVSMGGLACDLADPRVVGYIHHYHRFVGGDDELLVGIDGFVVDLDGPAEENRCYFQDGFDWNGHNASGMTYTIRVDAEQNRADTDGDSIPDSWETNGIDSDCDGTADILLQEPLSSGGIHHQPADPSVKDIYVEVDWMDCALGGCEPIEDGLGNPDLRTFEPPDRALELLEQSFADHGYALHLMKDSAIPVSGYYQSSAAPGATPTISDSQYTLRAPAGETDGERYIRPVYEDHFGTSADTPQQVAIKRHIMRYAVFDHSSTDGAGGNGYGKYLHVGFHIGAAVSYERPPITGFDRNDSGWFMARVLMHELGHYLGLGHGGVDGCATKPNSLSVMPYLPGYLADWATSPPT